MRSKILFLTFLVSFSAFSQIVDDSTKLVYGPTTTSYVFGADLYNNQEQAFNIDTSIYRFEEQSFVDRSGNRFQDLGVFGTALYPIFLAPDRLFGRTSGYDAYARFAYDPFNIKYYDTKSPYLELFAYLGGGNRNLVNVDFSRNINPNWNIGFGIKKITNDQQLAPDREGDRHTVGTGFVAYTKYEHPVKPYKVALNYSSFNHEVDELGGVRQTTDSLQSDFFQYQNALLRLEGATTNVKFRRFYLLQDYELSKEVQIYHQLYYNSEENTYRDFEDGTATSDYDPYRDFYPNFLIDPDSTYQRSLFTAFSNEVGIKGDHKNIFYRIYGQLRKVDFDYFLLDPDEEVLEKYLGGSVRFDWREKFSVTGSAQYLFGGEYQIDGTLSSDLINVSYTSMNFAVPFIFNNYFGNHQQWATSFRQVLTNSLSGNIQIRPSEWLNIVPAATFTSYNNFVYFDESQRPQQADEGILISTIGGDVNFHFLNAKGEGLHLENEVLGANVSGGSQDVVRVPELFYNGRYYWKGNIFEDKIPIEVGINAHARSTYFANAFAPEIQQFYLQNEIPIQGYYKADLFVNMRIDKFFMGLKFTHVDQPADGGYFATPYYPGQPRAFDLIIKWMFFD